MVAVSTGSFSDSVSAVLSEPVVAWLVQRVVLVPDPVGGSSVSPPVCVVVDGAVVAGSVVSESCTVGRTVSLLSLPASDCDWLLVALALLAGVFSPQPLAAKVANRRTQKKEI